MTWRLKYLESSEWRDEDVVRSEAIEQRARDLGERAMSRSANELELRAMITELAAVSADAAHVHWPLPRDPRDPNAPLACRCGGLIYEERCR